MVQAASLIGGRLLRLEWVYCLLPHEGFYFLYLVLEREAPYFLNTWRDNPSNLFQQFLVLLHLWIVVAEELLQLHQRLQEEQVVTLQLVVVDVQDLKINTTLNKSKTSQLITLKTNILQRGTKTNYNTYQITTVQPEFLQFSEQVQLISTLNLFLLNIYLSRVLVILCYVYLLD